MNTLGKNFTFDFSRILDPQQNQTSRFFKARRRSASWLAPHVLITVFIACCLVLLAGCAQRAGATREGAHVVWDELSASALSGRVSDATVEVVHRNDLDRQLKRDPDSALKLLHTRASTDERRDNLYALAELNYYQGVAMEHSVKPGAWRRAPNYFLSSAIYAWFYLLGSGPEPLPTPFDERFRVACNIYNRGLARGMSQGYRTNSTVHPEGGQRNLVPGQVKINFDRQPSNPKIDTIQQFLSADEFAVHGFSVRNRESGLGAPLIAVAQPSGNEGIIQPRIPMTMLLRVSGNLQTWSKGELAASLELYSNYETNFVQADGQHIPLEADLTAPLAHRLNDSRVWNLEFAQFFSPKELVKSSLYSLEPYEPGKIPVIFVHGTFSSPIRWAEMLNTLNADPELRKRCRFWYFIYNSGNPIPYSAAKLRTAIEQKIIQFDPSGNDPALKQMVLIGHSQGGLLCKLTATDTGSRLWNTISDRDFDSLSMSEKDREQLRSWIFFKPLPGVKRLVFIATPHRGSYMNSGYVRRILGRFMTLPKDVMNQSKALLTVIGAGHTPKELLRSGPNSLYGMSVSNKTIGELSKIPPAPGVISHSIIAVKGNGPPEEGADGVVAYKSAHVDYAESELVVRSSHSVQGNPAAIEEVRRILHEHLNSVDHQAH